MRLPLFVAALAVVAALGWRLPGVHHAHPVGAAAHNITLGVQAVAARPERSRRDLPVAIANSQQYGPAAAVPAVRVLAPAGEAATTAAWQLDEIAGVTPTAQGFGR